MGAPIRLTPTMVSRKLAALKFIETYFDEHQESPSLGEIAAALGPNITRQDAHAIGKQLAAEGKVYRQPGRRGIIPLSARDKAIELLRRAGYSVDEDILALGPPAVAIFNGPVTNPPLPMLPDLDHIRDVEIGDGHDGTDAG